MVMSDSGLMLCVPVCQIQIDCELYLVIIQTNGLCGKIDKNKEVHRDKNGRRIHKYLEGKNEMHKNWSGSDNIISVHTD